MFDFIGISYVCHQVVNAQAERARERIVAAQRAAADAGLGQFWAETPPPANRVTPIDPDAFGAIGKRRVVVD